MIDWVAHIVTHMAASAAAAGRCVNAAAMRHMLSVAAAPAGHSVTVCPVMVKALKVES